MVYVFCQGIFKQIFFFIDGFGLVGDGIIFSNVIGFWVCFQDCCLKFNFVIVVGNVDDVIDVVVEDLYFGFWVFVFRVCIVYEGSLLFFCFIYMFFSVVGVLDSVFIVGVVVEWHFCVGRFGGEEFWVSVD